MVNKKYRTLKDDEGKLYVFSEEKLNQLIGGLILEKRGNGEKCNKSSVMQDLACDVAVSLDAVKNWSLGRNGVGDMEMIKAIAKFFDTEYHNLLEEKPESINTVNDIQRVAISNLYHKIQPLLELIGRDPDPWHNLIKNETPFNKERRLAGITLYSPYYDSKADDLIKEFNEALKFHMADIPFDLYDQLNEFVNDELGGYVGKHYVEMICTELREELESKGCDYYYCPDVKAAIKEDIEYIYLSNKSCSIYDEEIFLQECEDIEDYERFQCDVDRFLQEFDYGKISEGLVWNNQIVAVFEEETIRICEAFFRNAEKELFSKLRRILKPYVR